jgi:hypothetical protein
VWRRKLLRMSAQVLYSAFTSSELLAYLYDSTSGFSELPPIVDQIPPVDPPPAASMYTLFLLPIENFSYTITHRPSKRKASPASEQPLSEKRGKHPQSSTPVAGGGRKTTNNSAVATTPASTGIQDVTSVIEEFTDVMAESPATERVSGVKSRALLQVEDMSVITTPGRADVRPLSKASVVRPKSSATTATAKQPAARKKTAKAKPELVTPAEFARRLQEQAIITESPPQTSDVGSRKARQSSAKLPVKAVQPPQYLKGHVIFYTGGDLTYASARTRGCMNYVRALLVTFSRM